MIWEIPSDLIPPDCKPDRAPSKSGDDCHYNIRCLSNADARNAFIKLQPNDFEMCTEGGLRQMTQADFDELKKSGQGE